MTRIDQAFQRARNENRAAFVGYLCAGDPDFQTSVDACRTLLESGVDILELGVPFSDPLADGITNQLAAQRALENGMTTAKVFDLVRAVRSFSEAPIVFYTYYNLVFSNGVENYVRAAKAAGVDSILTLDLPPEEADEMLATCKANDVSTVFIVAPTTPDSRLAKIAAAATGFIYYVSREGVTGERTTMAGNIPDAVAAIRRHSPLPVVVGFGISTPQHVSQVASVADGVVVGSALVNCIRDNVSDRPALLSALREKTKLLATGLRVNKVA